jgi:hypothetical protein
LTWYYYICIYWTASMSRVLAKSVRASFTADEDTLLMKYIATYNPAKKYRCGNALYKCLEANVDNKWNWSKTHPWQSWQYRYRKNMEEFDRRILKYQKKKGIDPEDQLGIKSQFPSFDEEAMTDRSKETSKGKKRAGSQESFEQQKVKRAKLERDQPDAGSSRSPLMKTDGTRPKRVLKHKPISPIFGSLSPTHHYSAPLRTKILPKVIEGHFTTALTDRPGRVGLGGHSEEKQAMTWPPVRGKKGKAAGCCRTSQAEVVETAVNSSEGDDDEAASGEEDEESNDDIKDAEEESFVERLVSGFPLEDLQDQDGPEYDAENEPELAPDDAEQLDEDDRHQISHSKNDLLQ